MSEERDTVVVLVDWLAVRAVSLTLFYGRQLASFIDGG